MNSIVDPFRDPASQERLDAMASVTRKSTALHAIPHDANGRPTRPYADPDAALPPGLSPLETPASPFNHPAPPAA